MEELKIEQLKEIDGGFELGIGSITLLSIGIPFVIGLVDGFVRTLPCK